MYCRHCGKEIADDSKFCQYCGGQQVGETSKELKAKKEITIPTIKTNLSTKAKIWIWGYVIWVFLNLYALVYAWGYSHTYYFFPFTDSPLHNGLENYDFTEFIVYVFLLPLLIYGGYKYYKKHQG